MLSRPGQRGSLWPEGKSRTQKVLEDPTSPREHAKPQMCGIGHVAGGIMGRRQ